MPAEILKPEAILDGTRTVFCEEGAHRQWAVNRVYISMLHANLLSSHCLYLQPGKALQGSKQILLHNLTKYSQKQGSNRQ